MNSLEKKLKNEAIQASDREIARLLWEIIRLSGLIEKEVKMQRQLQGLKPTRTPVTRLAILKGRRA